MAPQLLEYRLFFLLTQIIWTELFFLICPDDINLDLVMLFNVRNFSVFASTIAPCGRIGEGYYEIERSHVGRSLKLNKTTPKYHDFRVLGIIRKVKEFYQSKSQYIDGKRNTEVDKDFIKVWNDHIPEPHRSDIRRAHNLR
jgi:hypothetical protein